MEVTAVTLQGGVDDTEEERTLLGSYSATTMVRPVVAGLTLTRVRE